MRLLTSRAECAPQGYRWAIEFSAWTQEEMAGVPPAQYAARFLAFVDSVLK